MYEILEERDLETAVWLRKAQLPQTKLALVYMQRGQYEEARKHLLNAMQTCQVWQIPRR